MKLIYLFFLALILSSCSTQAPKEDEVKEMVQLWYQQQSSGDGAAPLIVNGVTVLSIKEDENKKDIFNTVSLVSGVRKSPALEVPLPDKEFNDTLRMNLRWNGARWVTAD
jgi:hypothetical protein